MVVEAGAEAEEALDACPELVVVRNVVGAEYTEEEEAVTPSAVEAYETVDVCSVFVAEDVYVGKV